MSLPKTDRKDESRRSEKSSVIGPTRPTLNQPSTDRKFYLQVFDTECPIDVGYSSLTKGVKVYQFFFFVFSLL